MRRTQTGSATIETVLLVPVLFFIILLVVQFGVWQHASHIARAAAQEGARAARFENGTEASGRARAIRLLDESGRGVVDSVQIETYRDDDVAAVVVSGTAQSLLPGIALPVNGISQGPVERFRPAA